MARSLAPRSIVCAAAVALSTSACAPQVTPGPARALAIWQEMEAAELAAATPDTLLPVGAQATVAAVGRMLGPADVLALARDRSPEIALADAEAQVQEAAIGVARQLENPELRITNIRRDRLEGERLDVALRVPIPRPWSQRARVQGARQAALAARAEVDEAARRLRARVYHLFARLAFLRGDQALAELDLQLRARRRVILKSRVDKAVATRLDLQLEDVDYHESVAAVEELGHQIAAIEDELRSLCAAGPRVRFAADPSELAEGVDVGDRRVLVELALGRRPVVEGAAARVGEAQSRAAAARGEVWPWLKWAQVGHAFPGAGAASWGVGVILEVPLLSLHRGDTRRADAEVRLREVEEAVAVAGIVREVDEARARALRSGEFARRLESGLVRELRGAVELAQRTSDAGALDPLRVIDLELDALRAQRRLLEAQYARRRAVIDLEAAVGMWR